MRFQALKFASGLQGSSAASYMSRRTRRGYRHSWDVHSRAKLGWPRSTFEWMLYCIGRSPARTLSLVRLQQSVLVEVAKRKKRPALNQPVALMVVVELK